MMNIEQDGIKAVPVIGKNKSGVLFPLLFLANTETFFLADINHVDGKATNQPVFARRKEDDKYTAVEMNDCEIMTRFEDKEYIQLCEAFYRGVNPENVEVIEEE